jgi:hypothetical protein
MALQSIKLRPPANSPSQFGGAIAGIAIAIGVGGENAQLDAVRHARAVPVLHDTRTVRER